MSNEPEILVTGEMTNVCRVTGDQIVDGDHAMAFGQKPIYQMRAEETRAAGHNGNRLGIFGGHCAFLLMVAARVYQQEVRAMTKHPLSLRPGAAGE